MAEAKGDPKALADYRESLALLEKIHEAKLKNIQADEVTRKEEEAAKRTRELQQATLERAQLKGDDALYREQQDNAQVSDLMERIRTATREGNFELADALKQNLEILQEKLKVNKRATGGPVKKGEPYLVGEEGPEIVEFPADGDVIPNHRLGDYAGNGSRRFASGGRIAEAAPSSIVRHIIELPRQTFTVDTTPQSAPDLAAMFKALGDHMRDNQ
jgi:hypothetical protein